MFFSVKTAIKIGGKSYLPCICYALPDVLAPTVDKLIAEGKAHEYETKVYFQNGKVLEKKAVVKESLTTKKGKKGKKEVTPVVTEVESVTDTEAEGF